jgi:hypothetical protein
MSALMRFRFDVPLAIIAISSVAVVTLTAIAADISVPNRIAIISAGLVSLGGTAWMLSCRRRIRESVVSAAEQEREEFETVRAEAMRALQERAERLDDRERDLTTRLARFQEFMEYPQDDPNQHKSSAELQQLTDQDRQAQDILEGEAERVYEKIRANGYSKDGVVDLRMIRDEVEDLVERIARIYSPDSQHPLLETSFEQLARASSRICLHSLVLLEQLPLSIQQYNISDLYSYLQKATAAWGTYQKAAPWLKHVSRGLYAGRLVATTNPISLGAWWLAMEVGRRGATHLVESWVDRQAIAVLHDMVTVVGVEVASIYGDGFRQRDAAWVHGCEIVELMHCFPSSREGLQQGLMLITQLPLKNEYDRIYLYRCLATHRSTGHRIADSSLLSRAEREAIASSVEDCFHRFIHGVTDKQTQEWRSGLEERLDLKLNLQAARTATPKTDLLTDGLASLQSFLTGVVGLTPQDADAAIARTRIARRSRELASSGHEVPPPPHSDVAEFRPPDLDPASDLTTDYLHDLALLAAYAAPAEDHVVEVVHQTGAWFRRSPADMSEIMQTQWRDVLTGVAGTDAVHSAVTGQVAREILICRQPTEILRFSFPNIGRSTGDDVLPLEDVWLIGFQCQETKSNRALLMGLAGVLWEQDGTLTVQRRRSILLDDAEIIGGRWLPDSPGAPTGNVVVSGSLLGGRYSSYFRTLLES